MVRDWRLRNHAKYCAADFCMCAHAEKNELLQAIILKYHPDWLREDDTPPEDATAGSQEESAPSHKQRNRSPQNKKPDGGKNRPLKEVAPRNRDTETEEIQKKSSGLIKKHILNRNGKSR